MYVPGGGGSAVRMYNPPIPRFATRERCFIPAFCQASMVPFGEGTRGYWRRSFIAAAETEDRTILLFHSQLKKRFQLMPGTQVRENGPSIDGAVLSSAFPPDLRSSASSPAA